MRIGWWQPRGQDRDDDSRRGRTSRSTGEEQGLYGSREYVKRHAEEMERTSVALIHDTGTGKVTGFATHSHAKAN